MHKKIHETLEESLNETNIDLIEPDEEEIQVILKMKSYQISSLSESMLTRYIYSLSQYLIFLQAKINTRHIKYLEAKLVFESKLSTEALKIENKKTVKEKEHMALIGSKELQDLELEMRVRSADYRLFDKITDHLSELINALKKELSNRQGFGGQSRGKHV